MKKCTLFSPQSRRAQIAYEFVSYVAISIAVVLVLSSIALKYSSHTFDKQHEKSLEDLAYATQKEILVASRVHEGYSHSFTLPQKVVGGFYTINNTNTTVTFIGELGSITLDVPFTEGSLIIGENNIRNNHGIVTIN